MQMVLSVLLIKIDRDDNEEYSSTKSGEVEGKEADPDEITSNVRYTPREKLSLRNFVDNVSDQVKCVSILSFVKAVGYGESLKHGNMIVNFFKDNRVMWFELSGILSKYKHINNQILRRNFSQPEVVARYVYNPNHHEKDETNIEECLPSYVELFLIILIGMRKRRISRII